MFQPRDFEHDPGKQICICPAGQRLYRNGANVRIGDLVGVKFRGAKSVCGPCALRAQCLRKPDIAPVRQVVFFRGRAPGAPETFTAKMQRKVDSVLGKVIYGRRLAVAEPPFADIRHAKGLSRFTLRGRAKVNGQWQLYCMVHNLFKVYRYGEGFT